MVTAILGDMVGILILMIFPVLLWWILRVQEAISTGDISHLPQWMRYRRGYDVSLLPESKRWKPPKRWRLLPIAMLLVPLVAYVVINNDRISILIRLAMAFLGLLVFNACAYFIERKTR